MKTLGLCLLATLSLGACTTGISSSMLTSHANKMITQYPIERALINIYSKPSNYTSYLVDDQLQLAVQVVTLPLGTVTFDGKPVHASRITSTIYIDNQNVNTSIEDNYYSFDPLVFHGFSGAERYAITSQTQSVPKVATVGDFSTFLTENVYTDSSLNKKIGTYLKAWSLSKATNNSAWLCISRSANILVATDAGTPVNCYVIDPHGKVLDKRVEYTYPTDKGLRQDVYVKR